MFNEKNTEINKFIIYRNEVDLVEEPDHIHWDNFYNKWKNKKVR